MAVSVNAKIQLGRKWYLYPYVRKYECPCTSQCHLSVIKHLVDFQMSFLLRSQLNAKISLSFKRDFENDHSKLRILVDSRLENQRIWRFVSISTIYTFAVRTLALRSPLGHARGLNRLALPIEPNRASSKYVLISWEVG